MKGLNIFVRIISGIVFRMLSEIRNSKSNAGALMFPLLDNIKLNKKTAWNLFIPGKSITHTHTHTHYTYTLQSIPYKCQCISFVGFMSGEREGLFKELFGLFHSGFLLRPYYVIPCRKSKVILSWASSAYPRNAVEDLMS